MSSLGCRHTKRVEQVLLRALLKHDGIIKEFGASEEIVDEIAEKFALTERQRSAFLETIYRKENRLKKSSLWHRLLFRAADSLAKENLVSRPTETLQLTKRREWMLTEKGFDTALRLCDIPISEKENLPAKSFEVQKIVKKLIESPKAKDYAPFDKNKKVVKKTQQAVLRNRPFRLAVVEAYQQRCAVCGLKIKSPDLIKLAVEAAHIVPIALLAETIFVMELLCAIFITGHLMSVGSVCKMTIKFWFHHKFRICLKTTGKLGL